MTKGTIALMIIWAVLALVVFAMGLFAVTPTVLPVLWKIITIVFGALNAMVIVSFGVLIRQDKKKV